MLGTLDWALLKKRKWPPAILKPQGTEFIVNLLTDLFPDPVLKIMLYRDKQLCAVKLKCQFTCPEHSENVTLSTEAWKLIFMSHVFLLFLNKNPISRITVH